LVEQKRNLAETNIEKHNESPVFSRKEQRKQEAERRKRLKPLLDRLKKSEQAVEKYHSEQKTIEQQLADPTIYSDTQKENLKTLLAQKVEVDNALEAAEMEWMEVGELLEQED
jgi:ATP-binding cassette subfamily F protein 3